MVLFAGAGVAHNNDVVHDAGRAQRRLEADADTRGRGRLGVVARTTRVAERQRGQRQGRAGRGAQSVRHDAPLTCDASVVLLTGPLRRESPRRGDGTACAAPGGAARAARWRPNPRAPVRSLSHPPSSPRLLSVPSCGCAAPALTFFFFLRTASRRSSLLVAGRLGGHRCGGGGGCGNGRGGSGGDGSSDNDGDGGGGGGGGSGGGGCGDGKYDGGVGADAPAVGRRPRQWWTTGTAHPPRTPAAAAAAAAGAATPVATPSAAAAWVPML